MHLTARMPPTPICTFLDSGPIQTQDGLNPTLQAATCAQDFMGFLHLGWDIADRVETEAESAAARAEEAACAAWVEVARCVDVARPGLAPVRRVMGWGPLHVAAMGGHPALVRRLVQTLGCDLNHRSANSWTALHCAAAHNQVRSAAYTAPSAVIYIKQGVQLTGGHACTVATPSNLRTNGHG